MYTKLLVFLEALLAASFSSMAWSPRPFLLPFARRLAGPSYNWCKYVTCEAFCEDLLACSVNLSICPAIVVRLQSLSFISKSVGGVAQVAQASAGFGVGKGSKTTVRKAQTKVLDVNVALALKRGQKGASAVSSSTTATTLGTSSLHATASSSAPRQPSMAAPARPSSSAATPSAATRPSPSETAQLPPIDHSHEPSYEGYGPDCRRGRCLVNGGVSCVAPGGQIAVSGTRRVSLCTCSRGAM